MRSLHRARSDDRRLPNGPGQPGVMPAPRRQTHNRVMPPTWMLDLSLATAALVVALALRPWRAVGAAGPPWAWAHWCGGPCRTTCSTTFWAGFFCHAAGRHAGRRRCPAAEPAASRHLGRRPAAGARPGGVGRGLHHRHAGGDFCRLPAALAGHLPGPDVPAAAAVAARRGLRAARAAPKPGRAQASARPIRIFCTSDVPS